MPSFSKVFIKLSTEDSKVALLWKELALISILILFPFSSKMWYNNP